MTDQEYFENFKPGNPDYFQPPWEDELIPIPINLEDPPF